MPRLALRLNYDGSQSIGWQTQPNGLALQDELEQSLCSIAQEPVHTICAGRTDAGVHAVAQVVHFDTQASRPLQAWVRGVNSRLSSRLAVTHACEVAPSFHARFSARRRRYHYVIYRARTRRPLFDRRATWVHRPLDLKAMRLAADTLVGEHDFSAFRSSQCQAASPIRTLEPVVIHEAGDLLAIEFIANAFLHHMIRNIVGSLVEVAAGRKPVSWIEALRDSRDRTLAAGTFAPNGLYLTGVDYGGAIELDLWPAMPPGLLWG